jgi:GntR family transcriptional regulator
VTAAESATTAAAQEKARFGGNHDSEKRQRVQQRKRKYSPTTEGSAMNLKIDPASGLPIYLQLIEQIKYHISVGTIRAEDQLPSVRKLSTDLRVNPNTIAKAFNIMETEGIVYSKRGEGTFISPNAAESSKEERRGVLKNLLKQVAETAEALNVPPDEVHRMMDECFKETSNTIPSGSEAP